MRRALLIVALVLALRLPFLNQAIQGDDVYYLAGAEHAQIEPLHPNHTRYLFMGDLVDMRGHSHPPFDTWFLGALLAIFKEVREVPFHLAFTLFSVIAALAMDSLARRFSPRPWLATILFLAVPAFIVNGNSLESDVPFLAFWMAAVALFAWAVETSSAMALVCAAGAAAFAGLTAYQAVFLTPVLAAFLISKRSGWRLAWAVTLAAPLSIGAWLLFERLSSGALPAAVLAGYMSSYGWQAFANKLRNGAALTAHLGWIVSPMIVLAVFLKGPKWRWLVAGIAALAAAVYDPNPMCWLSIGCGVLVLSSCFRISFLEVWALIFFAGVVIVCFAGSARYLLPLAAPVAIIASRIVNMRLAAVALALQFAISLGLAIVNYQHWGGYREFARSVPHPQGNSRTWVNGDWGLRFYLEADGGVTMAKSDQPQPGDIVVSSELSHFLTIAAAMAPLASAEIQSWIPLRLISLGGRSGYSDATRGLRAFEFSTAPLDRVRADLVIERKPVLTWVTPQDREQIVSGLFPDGWMEAEATVLVKRVAKPLRAMFTIPPQSPGRRVELLVDGKSADDELFPGPGSYSISIPPAAGGEGVTVTLRIDKTFSVPPDQRKLGMIVTGIGFQ